MAKMPWFGRMYFCARCNAMVATTKAGELQACTCGHHYFKRIESGVWRLNDHDKTLLRSLRIASDDSLPFEEAQPS